MLHDYHKMHSAMGGELSPTGKHLEELFPERVRLWLYRWSLDRGHLDGAGVDGRAVHGLAHETAHRIVADRRVRRGHDGSSDRAPRRARRS